MLGNSAVSARSISGSPYKLITVAVAISATFALTFSGSAQWGAYQRMSATGHLSFAGSAIWTTRNALSAVGQIQFGGIARLRTAGRPIVFYAAPERLDFIAQADRLTFTAKPDNFTFRGMW